MGLGKSKGKGKFDGQAAACAAVVFGMMCGFPRRQPVLGKVFKAYDVRATYPKPLNEKLAWQIGYASARFLIEQAAAAGHDDPMMRHLVVGRDMRKSSPALSDALKQGINDYGGHVIDVGLVDTPFVYFAINYLGCCGGVQTTASHNPANYNGFKISAVHAVPVGAGSGLNDIRRHTPPICPSEMNADTLAATGQLRRARDLWSGLPPTTCTSSCASNRSTARGRCKVFVDASNGMAGQDGAESVCHGVHGISRSSRSEFRDHQGLVRARAESARRAENIEQLRRRTVRESQQRADLGRLFRRRCRPPASSPMSRAEIIGCDHLTALARPGDYFLKKDPGFDHRLRPALEQSRGRDGHRVRLGGQTRIRSRVGHVFMKQAAA